MGYLKEFQTQIANHDYAAVLRLWEEYYSSDELDGEELIQILKTVKKSEMAEAFGRHVDKILPLWKMMEPSNTSHEVFKLITDLASSNNEALAQLTYDYLKERYGQEEYFNEKIRLIGLRNKERFQGAVSNYELLSHMIKGKYVFHTGGWGVGEIIEVSVVREQLRIEFDYVPGQKDISFDSAFKTLTPIPDDHFLALRFGSPDTLEKMAKDNPAEVIRKLLSDLGPKTAAEIKDELCDLVIPAAEWVRWWQNARAKIKKDTMIQTPDELREPFLLRHQEISHEARLQKTFENLQDPAELIQTIYTFLKDFPETLKNTEFKTSLQAKLKETLAAKEISDAQELQIHFFLQDLGSEKEYPAIAELVKNFSSIEEIVEKIEILSFKKRLFIEVRKNIPNWKEIFLRLLFSVEYNPLRDYLVGELIAKEVDLNLKKRLEELLANPGANPELFLWYFQKIMSQPSLPFADKHGKNRFFESLLVLLSFLENQEDQRDLVRKIHSLLSSGRYAIVRQIMQGATVEECKEFLLLATKCHSLSDHDIKILHSLAEVVHPSLAKGRKKQDFSAQENQVIWTTQEGYQKVKNRIEQIATVETVQVAKEIEVARAHGDLRENAEFKAALEKRDRLQSELKLLSDQINRCRVITKDDVTLSEVGVGVIVDCKNTKGEKISYTLLGPWDADPERFILSFQSKLAQTMNGLKVGDHFQFQNEEFTITKIRSAI